MSERSPLLPRAPAHKRSDHSMFLRVCHSPHRFIGQRTLQALRGLISVYMIGAFAAKMYYDYEIVHHFGNDVGAVNHGWRAVFELSNLSWLLLTMYEAVAFVWTYMHLHYPKLQQEPDSSTKKIKEFLSPSRVNPSTLNRFLFCFFYNGATVLNPLVTFMHWAVIVPHKKLPVPQVPGVPLPPLDNIFGNNPFESWVIINFFIVNSVISIFEIFFLSSLRCDQPLFVHIVWGAITGLVLTAWLYLGFWVTGEWMYFFLNLILYTWQEVVAMVIAFICLLETLFIFTHFLIVARQSVTRRQTRRGRRRQQRLPQ